MTVCLLDYEEGEKRIMDYNKLAELLFPNITESIADLEKRFTKRDLPEGAEVTRFARVLNTYVISKFYRILYLSQSRLIFFVKF